MAGESEEQPNILQMSDEDFLKMGPPVSEPVAEQVAEPQADPVETPAAGETPAEPVVETPAEDPNPSDADILAGKFPAADGVKSGQEENKTPEGSVPGKEGENPVDPATGKEGAEGGVVPAAAKEGEAPKNPEAPKPEDVVPPVGSAEGITPPTPEAASEFYMKVMTPFQANGKLIELKDADEAIKLMQMGANYTRKMQAIAPHRNMLMMLEKNGLLDADRISYLIDLDKKNPDAIKKLIKESGIDPLEIDPDAETNYTPGSHKVSDAEVNFTTMLDDLTSTPAGKETLTHINSTWDDASKEVLWGEPSIMTIIHGQRESGIYDRIVTELDRQKMLGQIPPETPFLKAYKEVGDTLAAAGRFDDLVKKPEAKTPEVPAEPVADPAPTPAPQPVASRVAAPKPAVVNGDKASAASPTRSTPKPAKTAINPLAMSDDEFLAQFQGRV